MEFSISDKKNQPETHSDLLLVFSAESAQAAQKLYADDALLHNLLRAAAENKRGKFQAAQIAHKDHLHRAAVLCLQDAADPDAVLKDFQAASGWLKETRGKKVVFDLRALCKKTAAAVLPLAQRAAAAAAYRFTACKTGDEDAPAWSESIFWLDDADSKSIQAAFQDGSAVARAMDFVRDLANAPANLCTPEYLAQTAQKRAEKLGATAIIHDKKAIEKIGMGSFLSVARGSYAEPYFIELHYQGAGKDDAPVVLVGKGITFDSGGISLKPGAGMDEMKYDMCGAASVIAVFCAAAEAKLPLNLIALAPACENMPSGRANRPGDIVTALDGTTIEILNTDAEGRLILCDALAYAAQFSPRAVIDTATLTGACVIALGHTASGIMANDDALAEELLAAARESGDKAWQLPLWDDYREQLKSPFADLANIGGRPAGTITAAAFLSHFAEKYPWAHIDIAGTAWTSGEQKGATGRPVPLLLRYLRRLAEKTA